MMHLEVTSVDPDDLAEVTDNSFSIECLSKTESRASSKQNNFT